MNITRLAKLPGRKKDILVIFKWPKWPMRLSKRERKKKQKKGTN